MLPARMMLRRRRSRYNVQTDTVHGTNAEKTGNGVHMLRSKGDKTSATVRLVEIVNPG
jgi:hypothetical protein